MATNLIHTQILSWMGKVANTPIVVGRIEIPGQFHPGEHLRQSFLAGYVYAGRPETILNRNGPKINRDKFCLEFVSACESGWVGAVILISFPD